MFHTEQKEIERLAALDRYDLVDTPREQLFDRIASLTRRLLNVPMAAVSAIDGHRQWYKASEGLEATEVPRQDTICIHTIAGSGPLVVADVGQDGRFAAKAWATGGPRIRCYAGIPLTTSDGFNIGSLCAMGQEPRSFSPDDLASLADLAAIAMEALEYRLHANTDPLTKVSSRRAFKETAKQAFALAVRHGAPLSAIALDLDHFKAVNDSYGHPVGDLVIATAVGACVERLRSTDIAGRLGGEEFAFVLPHTDLAGALEVAEQLRLGVERISLPVRGDTLRITASFGVATLDGGVRDLDDLLGRADEALYAAKAAGRNQCRGFPTAEPHRNDPSWRRVFEGGEITFANPPSGMDCTVRGRSARGAELDVSSSAGLPNTFLLSIPSAGVDAACHVVSRRERNVEVEFDDPLRLSPPR